MNYYTTTLLLLIHIFSFSQSNNENALLWKIYGNQSKDTSYLYGTIHMIEKKDFVLTPQVKRTFKRANTLVMEVDLAMDDATKKTITKQVLYPNRKTIKDYLSTKDYQDLHSFLLDTLKIMPLKVNIYEMMTPFFLQAAILKEQLKNAVSYEERFAKMGKKKDKLFLETMQEQLDVVAGDSLHIQVTKLMHELRTNKLDANKEFKKMTDLYLKQDLPGLHAYINESLLESEESPEKAKITRDKMLDNRNKNWVPKLETWMKQKSLFVAVGAGHLSGENGVINLLRKQGFTVEPVF